MPDPDYIRFKAKRGYLLAAIALHATILSLLPILLIEPDYQNALALRCLFGIILGFILTFTFGVYLRTFYVIDKRNKELMVYFIFKVKTLKIENIKGIEVTDSPISGFRYALSSDDGLTIQEGKYDSFFINPENKEVFLETLSLKKATF